MEIKREEGIELTFGEIQIEQLNLSYDIVSYSEELICIRQNGKYGFIDKEEKELIPLIYEDAHSFSEGMAAVKKEGKYGFIDKDGKIIIPLIYEDAHSFSEGMAAVKKNGKYGFINQDGEIIISFIYEDAHSFSENLIAVKRIYHDRHFEGGRIYEYNFVNGYGFIDKKRKELIPLIYEDAHSFSEGMAAVKKNGEYGFINKRGDIGIPFDYEDAYSFSEGIAAVKKEGKYGFIDKTGKIIVPFAYSTVKYLNDNLFVLVDNANKQYLMKNNLKKEKILNSELNTNDIEKLKEILSKIKNANQIKMYYDLVIDGYRLTFDTLEARNNKDTTGGPLAIKKLEEEIEREREKCKYIKESYSLLKQRVYQYSMRKKF